MTIPDHRPRIYDELTHLYLLLDPTEDHEDEGALFASALRATARGPVRDVLELGAGAGNNAHYLRERFRMTLLDRSPAMLALSEARHADCAHVVGDMRTARLGRTFDGVVAHDAVAYLVAEEELAGLAATAFAHLRPGGAVAIAPDCVAESYRPAATVHEAGDERLWIRCVERFGEPEPGGTVVVGSYEFTVREGGVERTIVDVHRCGLFPEATWRRVLREAGFEGVDAVTRDVGTLVDEYGFWDAMFVARRPE